MNEEHTLSLEELGEIKTVKVYNQSYVNKQQKRIAELEEKISIRGGRIVESFSLKTMDKSPEDIINDTEGIIQTLVLKMYSGA